jgi:hypothetical protein
LNVANIDAAVEFYSKLFDAAPAKRRPGYANFAIAEPPVKLVLIEKAAGRGHGMVGALNHLGVEVESPEQVKAATIRLVREGLARGPGVDHLLLCSTEQGLGGRPRRRPLGGVHRARRRPRRNRSGLLDGVLPA